MIRPSFCVDIVKVETEREREAESVREEIKFVHSSF